MSDFLYSSARRPEGELSSTLRRYLGPLELRYREWHGSWGSLAVAAWSGGVPQVQEEGDALRVTVLHGTVRARAEAAAPANAPQHGGAEDLDGPFARLAIDRGVGSGRIVSDLMSFVPIYWGHPKGSGSENLVIGTHVDGVARACGRNLDFDLVSAADAVAHLAVSFPHTLYEGVEQFPPASARAWRVGHGWASPAAAYWEPVERRPYASLTEAATELRDAVAADVAAAAPAGQTTGILLSGGEDARAVLGAVPPDRLVRAFVYTDWTASREVRVARRVARAYGAEFVVGLREPDHYLGSFETTTRLIGSNNVFADFHGWRFHQSLGLRDLPVVLGGLSSDAMLKAYHEPVGRREAAETDPGLAGISSQLLHAASTRRSAHRSRLEALRPTSAAEWMALWPFSMRIHAANFHGNRRAFESHEPFHADRVVRLAASTPQSWKRGGRLFRAAFRPFLRPSWYLPHAKHRFPYFGVAANLPLSFGLWLARGVRAAATGEVGARQQPWPKMSRVAGSADAAALRRRYPVTGSPLAPLFPGRSEAQVEEATARWHPLRRLLLLQLAYLASDHD